MSWEAWGDDDARELPEGCWAPEEVEAVLEAIAALHAEQVYECGEMSRGISVRFLARLTVLRNVAGLLSDDDPFAIDARRVLGIS